MVNCLGTEIFDSEVMIVQPRLCSSNTAVTLPPDLTPLDELEPSDEPELTLPDARDPVAVAAVVTRRIGALGVG